MGTLVGNKNNPSTLKLLIANNYAKPQYTVTLKETTDRLPVLNTPEGEIFIPNAALWLLWPPVDGPKVREVLEIEATVLAPFLAAVLGGSVKSDKLKSGVLGCLKSLNGALQGKEFFVGKTVSIADIALFSTLYPLSKIEKLSKEYLNDRDNILAWIKRLELIPQFKEAIMATFPDPSSLTSSYQVLFQSSKYPQITSSEPDKESPKHEVDSVTPEELQSAQQAWKKDLNSLPSLKKPEKVVLPKAGEKNIFITSALPYVNNVPHLGNIIGCVLSADVFARYSRLCNNNTLFICGCDEYGTATETKALEEKLTCREICDKYFAIHDEIYRWFNISFDRFGRTSTPLQTELAQDLFLQLNHNGFMFTQSVDQLHCDNCQKFLADRFVEGGCPNVGCTYEDARGDQCDGCGKLVNAIELKNPRCKTCSSTPTLKTSNQFFIDLPKLEPLLHHWIRQSSPGWSQNASIIAKAWLKEGLKPRCITRDLKWGVPVPLDGFRNKVFYVWFDAPIGYISISKAYSDEYEQWWRPHQSTKVQLYQFMAKDNVPFHAILFPAILLGANRNYVTVSHIMATEYLNYEDGKFSKSRGVGVFGNDARDTKISSDVWRFYLLYVRPEAQDASFSWNDLATKNNSELLNNLGNFINRALIFVKNNFDRRIPQMELTNEDYTLLALCTKELKGYLAALEKCRLRDGIRHILAISRHGNQYMQVNQPWVRIKEGSEGKLRGGTVVGLCANLSCLLATLLQPYMPETSDKLKSQLNCQNVVLNPEHAEIVNLLPAGHQIGDPQPLFSKIELDTIEEYKKKFAGSQESRKTPPKTSNNAAELEQEVAKQGLVVRKLKEGGADKSIWQPEVAKLLELKKQLATLEAPPDVKGLEEAVAKQALVVRHLKEKGEPKTVWEPEVKKLLALKSQLTGEPQQKGKKSKK